MISTKLCIPNVMSNESISRIMFNFVPRSIPSNVLLIYHITIAGTRLATAPALAKWTYPSQEATWYGPRLTSSKINLPRGLLWLRHHWVSGRFFCAGDSLYCAV